MCWLQHAGQLRHYPQFLLWALAALGLVECYAGFRAWRFLLGFNGVLIGAFLGAMACAILLHNPILAVGGLVGGAIAGGILFSNVMPVGAFAMGFATGVSFLWIAASAGHLPVNTIISAAMMAVGLVTAGAAVCGGKWVITILTAVAGAQQLAAIWMAFINPLEEGGPVVTLPELAAFALMAAAGLAVQWKTAPKSGDLRR